MNNLSTAAAITLLVAAVIISASLSPSSNTIKRFKAPKQYYDICDQVKLLNAPCEHHVAQTSDGFLIDIVRIPAKNSSNSNGKPAYPVILQHGLIDAASTWVFNTNPAFNLGTILWSRGYDVWMPNSRGNHYSRDNVNFPAQEGQAYFDLIDFDNMALDTVAVIDVIKRVTNATSMAYAGHSQGTTSLLAGLSHPTNALLRHNLSQSLDFAALLAPVASVQHSTSLLLQILAHLDAAKLIELLSTWILENDWLLRQFAKAVCDLPLGIGELCDYILMPLVGGFNVKNIPVNLIPNILRYTPAGTSGKNLVHWEQNIDKDGLSMFDYGAQENQKRYNQPTPPKYNISSITGPPLLLAHGTDDTLSDMQDVANMITALQKSPSNPIAKVNVYKGWAHMDFVWGTEAQGLYADVAAMFQKYRKF